MSGKFQSVGELFAFVMILNDFNNVEAFAAFKTVCKEGIAALRKVQACAVLSRAVAAVRANIAAFSCSRQKAVSRQSFGR